MISTLLSKYKNPAAAFAAGLKATYPIAASPHSALPEKAGKAGKGEILHRHGVPSKKIL